MDNTTSLAKITPPRVHDVYLRERLFKELDAARKHPIIWISAPAGSGKTTLVASYLQQHKIDPLWYQVDAGDSDIASFFYYSRRNTLWSPSLSICRRVVIPYSQARRSLQRLLLSQWYMF